MNINILRTENNGVEFFTVTETGECGMSQRGLARACGKDEKTIRNLLLDLRTKSPHKRLDRFVGVDLGLRTSDIKRRGKKINALIAEFCAVAIKHYAYSGSEKAQEFDEALGAIGLTSYIQGITGWLPEQFQASLDARQAIAQLISDQPDKTKPKHFDKDWQQQATRVTGYNWQGLKMAQFIHRSIYSYFGAAICNRLDEVNPVVDGRHRANLNYQHFAPQIDESLLTAHIAEVKTLLGASISEHHFWLLMSNRFGLSLQLELPLD